MKFYGHIAMNQNQLQQASVQVETDFPATPVVGRLLFKDKTLYVCVDISGAPVWVPLTKEIDTYIHVQDTPSATWTITHNLHASSVIAQVYNASQEMVLPDGVEILSADSASITFTSPISGRAIVMSGIQFGGNQHQSYSYVHTQTNLSDTWVVNHNLGYEPIIRVFIGNQEVQPASIVHNSLFQSTVTFTTPYVGVARCI